MKSAKTIGMCLFVILSVQLIHSCAPSGYQQMSPRDFSPVSDMRPTRASNDPRSYDPSVAERVVNRENSRTAAAPERNPQPLALKNSSYITNAIVGGQDPAFRYKTLIERLASRYKIDAHLMLAIGQAESSGNPMAVSSVGCRGLTQLSIITARDYDADVTLSDLHDPVINLQIASRHMNNLKHQVNKVFPNASLEERVQLLASAWNSGWRRVRESGGVPRISETQVYSARVLKLYRKYRYNS